MKATNHFSSKCMYSIRYKFRGFRNLSMDSKSAQLTSFFPHNIVIKEEYDFHTLRTNRSLICFTLRSFTDRFCFTLKLL